MRFSLSGIQCTAQAEWAVHAAGKNVQRHRNQKYSDDGILPYNLTFDLLFADACYGWTQALIAGGISKSLSANHLHCHLRQGVRLSKHGYG